MNGVRYEASCPCGHVNRAFAFGVTAPLVCLECHRKTMVVNEIDEEGRPRGSDIDRIRNPHREHER